MSLTLWSLYIIILVLRSPEIEITQQYFFKLARYSGHCGYMHRDYFAVLNNHSPCVPILLAISLLIGISRTVNTTPARKATPIC